MDEDPSEPSQPAEPQRSDAAARSGDLEGLAGAAADATYGDGEPGRARVPGVLSGDVGPKGKVAAQLRDLSRHERTSYGEVPRGTVSPGGGRLILFTMLGIALVLLAFVLLLGWLVSR